MHKVTLFVILATALIALSGCAATSGNEGATGNGNQPVEFLVSSTQPDPGLTDNNTGITAQTVGVTIKNSKLMHVQLGGSSSCPPVIETVTLDKTTTSVYLNLLKAPTTACTDDYKISSYDVEVLNKQAFTNVKSAKVCDGTDCMPVTLRVDMKGN